MYKALARRFDLKVGVGGIQRMDGSAASEEELNQLRSVADPAMEGFLQANESEAESWRQELTFSDDNPFRGSDVFWILDSGTVVYLASPNQLTQPQAQEISRLQSQLREVKNAWGIDPIPEISQTELDLLVPVEKSGKLHGLGLAKFAGPDVLLSYLESQNDVDADLTRAVALYVTESHGKTGRLPLKANQDELLAARIIRAVSKWRPIEPGYAENDDYWERLLKESS
jgi:hypothetical protein